MSVKVLTTYEDAVAELQRWAQEHNDLGEFDAWAETANRADELTAWLFEGEKGACPVDSGKYGLMFSALESPAEGNLLAVPVSEIVGGAGAA